MSSDEGHSQARDRFLFTTHMSTRCQRDLLYYLVGYVDDCAWDSAMEFVLDEARRRREIARAAELAAAGVPSDAGEHVGDRGEEDRSGQVAPVERQVDVP